MVRMNIEVRARAIGMLVSGLFIRQVVFNLNMHAVYYFVLEIVLNIKQSRENVIFSPEMFVISNKGQGLGSQPKFKVKLFLTILY